MMPHDFLTMYSTKAVEYLIAVAFLLLFIPFWRFLNAERVLEPAVAMEARRWLGQVVEWFLLPDGVHFHPGHAWARLEGGDVVTVGADDFAHKLVGRLSDMRLPQIGAALRQGEAGWSLVSNGKSVDMLSPVDGTVVAVNGHIAEAPEISGGDPYGEGWLLKVQAPRLGVNVKHLLSGSLARRWMEDVCDSLRARMSPGLGQVIQDGGLPVDGMARSLDRERWDAVAREFLLT
jgi:glycine cleavage system H lipoate-binding protein